MYSQLQNTFQATAPEEWPAEAYNYYSESGHPFGYEHRGPSIRPGFDIGWLSAPQSNDQNQEIGWSAPLAATLPPHNAFASGSDNMSRNIPDDRLEEESLESTAQRVFSETYWIHTHPSPEGGQNNQQSNRASEPPLPDGTVSTVEAARKRSRGQSRATTPGQRMDSTRGEETRAPSRRVAGKRKRQTVHENKPINTRFIPYIHPTEKPSGIRFVQVDPGASQHAKDSKRKARSPEIDSSTPAMTAGSTPDKEMHAVGQAPTTSHFMIGGLAAAITGTQDRLTAMLASMDGYPSSPDPSIDEEYRRLMIEMMNAVHSFEEATRLPLERLEKITQG